MTPDFEAVGEMTFADLERLRSLLNPETLPSKANAVTGGAGTIPACVVCGQPPNLCDCKGAA